jgi:hypothetical protein
VSISNAFDLLGQFIVRAAVIGRPSKEVLLSNNRARDNRERGPPRSFIFFLSSGAQNKKISSQTFPFNKRLHHKLISVFNADRGHVRLCRGGLEARAQLDLIRCRFEALIGSSERQVKIGTIGS